uniref:Large ribosomal subunit protein bL32 n=1 Tax=Thermodesulfovibrio aggregans TaxID=86166 RepID=A0A7C4EQX6_9BACT
MANPRHRHTPSRRDKRRANWKINPPNLILCPQCKEPKLSHMVCPNCGFYKGRKYLETEE